MNAKSPFETDVAARLDQIQADLATLAGKVEELSSRGTAASGPAHEDREATRQRFEIPEGQTFPRHFPPPKPHGPPRPATPSAPLGLDGHDIDWWLARAGAALTVFAVILLYRYAIHEGWITPVVRVFTGAAIGAALFYWGRTLAPASDTDKSPVGLRELAMGAGFGAWYISAYAASVLYNLIPVPGSRLIFLLLSMVGGYFALNERRSTLAIVAVGAGFLGPVVLYAGRPSILAFALYIGVLTALAIVLYLMRGWQSVLWMAFVPFSGNVAEMVPSAAEKSRMANGSFLHLPFFDGTQLVLTLLIIAGMTAFTLAPSTRLRLVAADPERYPQPLRSAFATNWLTNVARLVSNFSPSAKSLDSLSVWFLTLAAPVVGIGVLSTIWWPFVYEAFWGFVFVTLAAFAYRLCQSSSDDSDEITHLLGLAALLWAIPGAIKIAQALLPWGIDRTWPSAYDAVALAITAIFAAVVVVTISGKRFIAALTGARAIAGMAVLFVVLSELLKLSTTPILAGDNMRVAFSIAELIAIVAGGIVWNDIRRSADWQPAAIPMAVMCYGALLLLDARVLGQIWPPLVTATFALFGTALLFVSRAGENRLLRSAGGATIAFVIIRLLFIDLVGVDTIWRVLLFLGCGALFLYTSKQLQNARKQEVPEST